MTVLYEEVKTNDGDLTVSQGQHGLLSADVAKCKHGPITIKERQRLVQQGAPELRHTSLDCRGRGVHRAVGAFVRLRFFGQFIAALQPL